MKTIGLIGGMTWHSTLEYYRLINAGIHERLGGSHSARCVLYSVDFDEIEKLQTEGAWDLLSSCLVHAAKRVEAAGADFLLICANTMHRLAEPVQAAVSIPLLHIADATATEVRRRGLKALGLLGTRYTMEQEFLRSRLEGHGLRILIPGEDERRVVHKVIYEELGRGIILDSSRKAYGAIIGNLQARGAEGVILGCTEIPLLIRAEDAPVPVFDTTALHATAAVHQALAE